MNRPGPRPSRLPLLQDSPPVAPRPPAPPMLRPQRLLHEAARDAARQTAPSGLGLDSAAVRQRMVERLCKQGLQPQALCEAFAGVPRHLFVDSALATQAYEDTSLPIGLGQTISKPSVVARMLTLLFESTAARRLGSLGRVLEIGTGCGYQTALLARLSIRVVSIERLQQLHEKALTNLADLCQGDLRLVFADGCLGHSPNAPYDSIVAAASGDALPPAWLEQLAVGGRLVAPVQERGRAGQVLVVVDRHESGFQRTVHDPVHFVALKSGTAR